MLLTLGLKLAENGALGSGNSVLELYQDRCNTLRTNQSVTFILSDLVMRENGILTVYAPTGTGGRIVLPVLERSPRGTRMTVFNPDRAELLIEGTRTTSVELKKSVTTSAPYFQIIMDTENMESIFKNVIVVASD